MMMKETAWSFYKKFAVVFSVTVFMSTALFIVSLQQKEQQSGMRIKRSENSNGTTTETCKDFLNCDDCTSFTNLKCMWCNTGNGKCMDYPIHNLYPHSSDCLWKDSKWAVCWLDFQVVIITVAVLGGILIIMVTCILVKFCKCCADCWKCLCCSWGCCDKSGGLSRSERKSLRDIERSLRMQQKKQELQLKYSTRNNRPSDVPYGTTGNYQQFDNEVV